MGGPNNDLNAKLVSDIVDILFSHPDDSVAQMPQTMDWNRDGTVDLLTFEVTDRFVYGDKGQLKRVESFLHYLPTLVFDAPRFFTESHFVKGKNASWVPFDAENPCGAPEKRMGYWDTAYAFTRSDLPVEFFNADSSAFRVGDPVNLNAGHDNEPAHWVIQGFQFVMDEEKTVLQSTPSVILKSIADITIGSPEGQECDFIVPIDQVKAAFGW